VRHVRVLSAGHGSRWERSPGSVHDARSVQHEESFDYADRLRTILLFGNDRARDISCDICQNYVSEGQDS
jgi:hypothetical protein